MSRNAVQRKCQVRPRRMCSSLPDKYCGKRWYLPSWNIAATVVNISFVTGNGHHSKWYLVHVFNKLLLGPMALAACMSTSSASTTGASVASVANAHEASPLAVYSTAWWRAFLCGCDVASDVAPHETGVKGRLLHGHPGTRQGSEHGPPHRPACCDLPASAEHRTTPRI